MATHLGRKAENAALRVGIESPLMHGDVYQLLAHDIHGVGIVHAFLRRSVEGIAQRGPGLPDRERRPPLRLRLHAPRHDKLQVLDAVVAVWIPVRPVVHAVVVGRERSRHLLSGGGLPLRFQAYFLVKTTFGANLRVAERLPVALVQRRDAVTAAHRAFCGQAVFVSLDEAIFRAQRGRERRIVAGYERLPDIGRNQPARAELPAAQRKKIGAVFSNERIGVVVYAGAVVRHFAAHPQIHLRAAAAQRPHHFFFKMGQEAVGGGVVELGIIARAEVDQVAGEGCAPRPGGRLVLHQRAARLGAGKLAGVGIFGC